VEDFWNLQRINWLAGLRLSEAETLRRASTTRHYQPGEAVFTPIRHPEFVYLLEEGLVRIYRQSSQGGEYTLAYIHPGEVFGEVSVLAERPRDSFAVARRRSRILQMPREVFVKTLLFNRSVLYEVTKKIGRLLKTCQSRSEDLVFRDVPGRLASLLLRLGEESGTRSGDRISLGLRLTQEEIAKLIGTTRQSASVALRELIEAGLIQREDRDITLVNLPGLRRLAELPASN
jgi:CRP-like cAMP-binding protein